jgi:hypothetical protein
MDASAAVLAASDFFQTTRSRHLLHRGILRLRQAQIRRQHQAMAPQITTSIKWPEDLTWASGVPLALRRKRAEQGEGRPLTGC